MKSIIYITNKNLRIVGEIEEKGAKGRRAIFHIFEDCKLLANQTTGVRKIEVHLTPQSCYKGISNNNEGLDCCPECFPRKWPGYAAERIQQEAKKFEDQRIQETAEKLARISIYGRED